MNETGNRAGHLSRDTGTRKEMKIIYHLHEGDKWRMGNDTDARTEMVQIESVTQIQYRTTCKTGRSCSGVVFLKFYTATNEN